MNTRFSRTTASSLIRTGCAVEAIPMALPDASPVASPAWALSAKAAAALLLVAALGACSTPLVSPELMAKSRLGEAELAAMDSAELSERRQALARQRAEASAAHLQAERSCWKQFAVSRCITESAQARRAIHDQLRADDIALQDEQRKRRLQKTDERLQTKQTPAVGESAK